MFGTDERVTMLTDIDLEGPNGEDLVLSRKTTTTFIFAGVNFKDDGYVLGVKGDDERYIPLPATEVKSLQAQQLLPSPLPAYKVPVIEYVFGYSLYIALGTSIAYYTIKEWVQSSLMRHRAEQQKSSELNT